MAWNPGQELFGSRYIIERKLGEGGVGITYLAKNRRGELRVIKTLREQILNDPKWIPHQDKLRHDFRDEALRLALCRHPHIVQVENVFDEDNLPCMAMEYIEGEDLGKRITNKGALPEGEALLYIRQIGEALILVHEKGLLHRDLKPSNIMMRAGKPEAVLIDFGLARQFISGGVLQHTENLTPGYAPPEQYVPDAERGEYIDVYALAATLYSLLTGQSPMPAPARLQNFTMRSPKELNSSVGDRVNQAIMQGMTLNYKFRPPSVQQWLDLLPYTALETSVNEHQSIVQQESKPNFYRGLLSTSENYSGEIIIFGPIASGKTSYLATLCYLPNLLKKSTLLSIEPLNKYAQRLAVIAEDILANKMFTCPTNIDDVSNLPFYSLSITRNSNVISIINKQVKLEVYVQEYGGSFFNYLMDEEVPSYRTKYLDKLSRTRYLALIINPTPIFRQDDKKTAQTLSIIERELNRRVVANEKSKYRIAVMFSNFDRPDVHPYKKNLNQFITLRFPETQIVLQNWSNTWRCSVAYFAYSAFGMMENMYEPNCEFESPEMRLTVIKNPKIWNPFGLVAPIYWLLTGKHDRALSDI